MKKSNAILILMTCMVLMVVAVETTKMVYHKVMGHQKEEKHNER